MTVEQDAGHIITVISALNEGKRWVDPDVSALAVIDDCPLSNREVDVLRATGEGYSVADIAAQLHLAQGTVRNYLSNTMRKTQTRQKQPGTRASTTGCR